MIEDTIIQGVGFTFPPGWYMQGQTLYDAYGPRDIVQSTAEESFCRRLAWRIFLNDLTGCGEKKRLILQCFNQLKAEWPERIVLLENYRRHLLDDVDDYVTEKWNEFITGEK